MHLNLAAPVQLCVCVCACVCVCVCVCMCVYVCVYLCERVRWLDGGVRASEIDTCCSTNATVYVHVRERERVRLCMCVRGGWMGVSIHYRYTCVAARLQLCAFVCV